MTIAANDSRGSGAAVKEVSCFYSPNFPAEFFSKTQFPVWVLVGNLYSPGGRSLVRNSATRAGEACRTPLVVASVLLRCLGLEICQSSFGDLHPSARHHIPGRLAFQVSVVPQSKHNFTVQVAIALDLDRIYSKVLRDVV